LVSFSFYLNFLLFAFTRVVYLIVSQLLTRDVQDGCDVQPFDSDSGSSSSRNMSDADTDD